MKKRYRQHVNPLKMACLVPRPEPLTLPPGPIEVELGCGDARFIIALARERPEVHYVGLDIRDAFLDFGRLEVARLALTNVQLERANLIVDLERLFPRGRIYRFYVNFPDPWFKARQHNRRWLSHETLPHLVRALPTGGEIFFQSDVWDSALEALALLESEPTLRNLAGEWRFTHDNPYGSRSSRELCVMEEQRAIWRLRFCRQPDAERSL